MLLSSKGGPKLALMNVIGEIERWGQVMNTMSGVDAIVRTVLDLYTSFRFSPPQSQFTILAAFVLENATTHHVISLATGSKCLPTTRFPTTGDALLDSHAEVLARRGAMLWLYHELDRMNSLDSSPSQWIELAGPTGKVRLKLHTQLYLYVSTVPCGDASTRLLAASQDPSIAAFKDSTTWATLPPGTPSRGRDNYSLSGVLRTKPGRADSPPTTCMSCSDKIARWNVLGIQGALLSRFYEPIYLDCVIIGGVDDATMRGIIAGECERAFWRRIHSISDTDLPGTYAPHTPPIRFTSIPFPHGKEVLTTATNSSNESLCYTADISQSPEVIINGYRRGVAPKHRSRLKFMPRVCKLQLYNRYTTHEASARDLTYFEAKQSNEEYLQAKAALLGSAGPFHGWVTSGATYEGFTRDAAE